MIVIDLPPPPSVNRTRKVDWRGHKKLEGWVKAADALAMAQKPFGHIAGQYEAHILLQDGLRTDQDNTTKALLDYAVRLNLVTNDSPKYLRRIVIEYGEAPEGVRLTLRPFP